jgi:hypothetical protein
MAHLNPDDELTDNDIRGALEMHRLEIELQRERARAQAAEARMRHIEQALKTAGRVLEPYLAGTRR